ncbi:MAG: DUF2863 family protein [Burkholderiaceae bacterium]
MKETRQTRGTRDRKAHLSADSEFLVSCALGMANSGSRVEDRYWDGQLISRLHQLLDAGHIRPLHDALDRLHQTDLEAYGALIEAVEECAESAVVEYEGQSWQILLVVAPVIAWTRFQIPAGPISKEFAARLAERLTKDVLAPKVRFAMAQAIYSVDQLPRDHSELRKLTLKLGRKAIEQTAPKPGPKMPDSAMLLADARFFIGVVAAPLDTPVFQWQAPGPKPKGGRVKTLERWLEHARPLITEIMPGCGFECLLPDAYHLNMRESDRRIRPFGVRAAVHYLTHALAVPADKVHAIIAAFGGERVDEYRIGLAVDADGEDIAHGVVWPLLGPETDEDDPSPLNRIREQLQEAGVTQVSVWPALTEPEFCDDCGAPLYPNTRSELVHAEMPIDVAPESVHFH